MLKNIWQWVKKQISRVQNQTFIAKEVIRKLARNKKNQPGKKRLITQTVPQSKAQHGLYRRAVLATN